jgi:hypothetical protein
LGKTVRLVLACLALLMLLALACSQSAANPVNWTSFTLTDCTDIFVTPSITNGVTQYTVSMGANPTIKVNDQIVNAKWIAAFYVVSNTVLSHNNPQTFTAADAVDGGGNPWLWDTDPQTPGSADPTDPKEYAVAGWNSSGDGERIYPTGNLTHVHSKVFTFGKLSLGTTSILAGFHFGYGSGDDSKFLKATVPQVPEPSSLAMLIGGPLFASIAALRHRRSR